MDATGKPKRHLCICPDRQLFLRINSEPAFKPHHFLSLKKNKNIIDHDSYVELNRLFRNYAYEIGRSEPIGTMLAAECRALVVTAYTVATLTDDEKDFIAQQIG